jgi:phosphate transport system ATP-binding protein
VSNSPWVRSQSAAAQAMTVPQQPRPRVRLAQPGSERSTTAVDASAPLAAPQRQVVFAANSVGVWYGQKRAVDWITMDIERNLVTALIGPSGCGKSTFLRCLNRMNDPIPGFRMTGELLYHGHDLYSPRAVRAEVRRRIGMVFQQPNPFPKSIYDNIAWAPRNLGMRHGLDERVEKALRDAALWDEVKDRLKSSAMGLSGGQQQRLCIARAIAIEPDVVLLDEPASALDPVATASIEDLIDELKSRYTIVIVTHNMQQAARASDKTAFFSLDEQGIGTLIEYADTDRLFTNPTDPRTEDYVTGQFG